jgi:hypothetical protein
MLEQLIYQKKMVQVICKDHTIQGIITKYDDKRKWIRIDNVIVWLHTIDRIEISQESSLLHQTIMR